MRTVRQTAAIDAIEFEPAEFHGTGRARVDWEGRRVRLTESELTLQLVAARWLDSLPPEVAPRDLARCFARIANRLARLWENPPVCLAYLDDLRVDRRGGRRGFPDHIAAEIQRLHAYFRKHCAPHPGRAAIAPKVDRWGLERICAPAAEDAAPIPMASDSWEVL